MTVGNSVHHAVNLWPVLSVALVVAVLLISFMPDWKKAPPTIPYGKSYTAVGAMTSCVQVYGSLSDRVVIRTPDDSFFDVFFRQYHEPLATGLAEGILKYHECGKVDGQVVHCFDSLKLNQQALPQLDPNTGKRIAPKP